MNFIKVLDRWKYILIVIVLSFYFDGLLRLIVCRYGILVCCCIMVLIGKY